MTVWSHITSNDEIYRCLNCGEGELRIVLIPADGIADGGEPYTDVEIRLAATLAINRFSNRHADCQPISDFKGFHSVVDGVRVLDDWWVKRCEETARIKEENRHWGRPWPA